MLDKATFNLIHKQYNKRWKYFSLFDMVDSATAVSRDIDNNIPTELLSNVVFQLDCMDQLRQCYAHELVITSGYRCPLLNAAVGGAPRSKHLQGLAVDFRPLSRYNTIEKRKLLIYYLKTSDIPFNKIILEPTWLHVEFSKDDIRKIIM